MMHAGRISGQRWIKRQGSDAAGRISGKRWIKLVDGRALHSVNK